MLAVRRGFVSGHALDLRVRLVHRVDKAPGKIRWLSNSAGNNKFETLVKYNQRHVFSVVADVEAYSQFVPWCKKSVIVESINPREKLADLTVGFMGVAEETFRSHVILEPFKSVTAIASSELYSKSPLKQLKNVWTFEPVGPTETRVIMELEFEFLNPFYTRITSHFLKTISNLAMSSFVARCSLVNPIYDEIDAHEETSTSSLPDLSACVGDPAKIGADPMQEVIDRQKQHEAQLEEQDIELLSDQSFRGIHDTFSSLASSSHFDEYEVEILARDFYKLTENGHGRLTQNKLQEWLEIRNPKIAERLFQAMDVDKNGALTLREFIRGVSLIVRGNLTEKKFVWFRNTADCDVAKEDLELAVECTLITRDIVSKRISPSQSLSYYERPDLASLRLVAPVYRAKKVNTRALDRLFTSL